MKSLKIQITILFGFLLLCVYGAQAESIKDLNAESISNMEKPLDFWDETIRLFGVSDGKKNIDATLKNRRSKLYNTHKAKRFQAPGFAYDLSDKISGDYSITYTPSLSGNASKFGFVTQLWENWFDLNEAFSLDFHMKVIGSSVKDSWLVTFVDANKKMAKTEIKGADTKGTWKNFSIKLGDLQADKQFDFSKIQLVQFEAGSFSEDTVIKFDKIAFMHGKEFFGITDKTIDQRMKEAEETREKRILFAMKQTAKKAHFPLMQAFAMLYTQKDVEEANNLVVEGLNKALKNHHWDLFENKMICRIYYYYSNRVGLYKGRLKPEVEKKLLEVLWKRTHVKNDIHLTRQSTWNLDGSENHDLSAKASSLVSSRIFMGEPEYKDRIYPDLGFGGGYYYGHSGYLGKDAEKERIQYSGGRANLKDGKEYNAEDHYLAWVDYFKRYFKERAKHGFFLEFNSPTYSKHTFNMIELIRMHGGDSGLSSLLDDFIDLFWASTIQSAPYGIQGGPKTRHHGKTGGYCGNTFMLRFKLGGVANADEWFYWSELSDYELPKVNWKMALDRDAMGTFVYKSRGIGEDIAKLPRPMGTERSLVIEKNSRFLKYVYVTPKYTLGTQMDYPLAVHSHLSVSGRWHGMTVNEDADARIVPVGIGVAPKYPRKTSEKDGAISMEEMYKTVQHESTFIFQKTDNFLQVNPDWFPLPTRSNDQGIYIGKAWDSVNEDSGWIFVQKGDVYAGVRPVSRDLEYERAKMKELRPERPQTFQRPYDDPTVKLDENCYGWNEDKSIILLHGNYIPVIIQTGDSDTYGSYENFMKAVKEADLKLYNTVVQEFDELVYTPPGKNSPEIIFNAANMEIPRVGGEHINYEYPKTFDSPYIQSDYASGKILIQFGGERLELDFTN